MDGFASPGRHGASYRAPPARMRARRPRSEVSSVGAGQRAGVELTRKRFTAAPVIVGAGAGRAGPATASSAERAVYVTNSAAGARAYERRLLCSGSFIPRGRSEGGEDVAIMANASARGSHRWPPPAALLRGAAFAFADLAFAPPPGASAPAAL